MIYQFLVDVVFVSYSDCVVEMYVHLMLHAAVINWNVIHVTGVHWELIYLTSFSNVTSLCRESKFSRSMNLTAVYALEEYQLQFHSVCTYLLILCESWSLLELTVAGIYYLGTVAL